MPNYFLLGQQWLGAQFTAWRATRRDDRGAITTETAVVTFLLIFAAIAVIAIIRNYAVNTANNFEPPPEG